MRWQDLAACKGMTELFFPTREDGGEDVEKCKALCRTCPVRKPCAEYALGFGDHLLGVWGCMSYNDRRRLRRAG